MVARNRYRNDDSSDDLPPRLRDRMHSWPMAEPRSSQSAPSTSSVPPRYGWLRDVSGLSLAFLLVAFANIVVLLLALWYLHDGLAQPIEPPS